MHWLHGTHYRSKARTPLESRLLLCAVLLLAAWPARLPAFAQPQAQPVEKVKAAFVYKFVAYVEWPEEVFDKDSPLRIGVLGNERLGDALAEITDGKTVHDKKIEVESSEIAEDLFDCQIVFVHHEDKDTMREYLKRYEEANILTIGDIDNFTRSGGVIKLIESDRRLAIEINVSAAERARLKISSKLLDLATVVNDEQG
jgi:hypothetical protein